MQDMNNIDDVVKEKKELDGIYVIVIVVIIILVLAFIIGWFYTRSIKKKITKFESSSGSTKYNMNKYNIGDMSGIKQIIYK